MLFNCVLCCFVLFNVVFVCVLVLCFVWLVDTG